MEETDRALALLKQGGRYALKKPKRSIVVSGVSAKDIVQSVVDSCNEAVDGLHAEVLAVENDFFGHTVTCTGLLTGTDILNALKKLREETGAFDEVVLAGNTMKEFEEVFLCGMSLTELKKKLGLKNIKINRTGGYGFVEILTAKQ